MPICQPSSALAHTPLYSEHKQLYCDTGHALCGADAASIDPDIDLGRYKYAGYGFNSPNMRAGNSMGVARAAEVKEEEALVLLVQSGRYLGYLPDHVARDLAGRASVWPVLPEPTSYSVDFAAIVRKRPEPDRKPALS